jgi:hypothetical protein
MNTKKISINEFLENPIMNSDDCFNFYDWFCSEHTLKRRMMSLVPKLKFLVKEGIIDGDSHYVWFKNNSPMSGSLYDDMRISRIDNDEEFRGGFCPTSGHRTRMKCNVWTLGNNEEFVKREFKSWSEFKREVKTNETLRNELSAHFSA